MIIANFADIYAKEIMDFKSETNSEVKERNGNVSDEGNSNFTMQRKSREKKKNKATDRLEIGAIRKKIFQYLEEEKEVPSIDTLVYVLEEDGLIYEYKDLKKLMHKIGYRYVRCSSPSRRHILVESIGFIGCKRIDYLRGIRECRAENRNVYFLHETYMEARDIKHRGDQCLRVDILPKINKKERLVILHFGSHSGLINGTFTTIKSESETGDHFGEVNIPIFEKWVDENLKDKLLPNSVIAVSSASYHSIQKDKKPREMWTSKEELKGWLRRHNIEFEENLEKIFLLDLIRKSRLKPLFVIDEILKSLGHKVLRLPPQHPELNPLEYVWAEIKKNISQNHGYAPVAEKRKLWSKMYSEYPIAEWIKWNELVKNMEDEYFDKEYKKDDIMDEIIERYDQDLNSDSIESDSSESDSMSD